MVRSDGFFIVFAIMVRSVNVTRIHSQTHQHLEHTGTQGRMAFDVCGYVMFEFSSQSSVLLYLGVTTLILYHTKIKTQMCILL